MLGYQRKYLRSLAHHLKPSVVIGKNKVNNGVLSSINDAFNTSELIKIKFTDKKNIEKLSKLISDNIKCDVVGKIGYVFIFYKKNENLNKRIQLPKK